MSTALDITNQRKSVQFHVETKATGDDRVIRFIASTMREDRDGDTIDPRGILTAEFSANPVFQPFHDYSKLPVGKVVNWSVDGDSFVIDVRFPTMEELGYESEADMPDQARMSLAIFRWYKAGYLNAVSIGFAPVPGKVKQRDEGGYHFEEVELLEVSAVPVPSNRDAVAIMRDVGDIALLKGWAEKVLDATDQKAGQTLNAQNRARARSVFEATVALMRSGGMDPTDELKRIDGDKGKSVLTDEMIEEFHKRMTERDDGRVIINHIDAKGSLVNREAQDVIKNSLARELGMTDDTKTPDTSTTKMHEDTAAELTGILDAQERRVKMLRDKMGGEYGPGERGEMIEVAMRMLSGGERMLQLMGMSPPDEPEQSGEDEPEVREADEAEQKGDTAPTAEVGEEPQEQDDTPDIKDASPEDAESEGADASRDVRIRFSA